MEVKNLMIGDWLQHANGKCYRVTRIDGLHDGRIHFACGTPHLWEYNNKFSSIPLTAEILEKNGFEKDVNMYVCTDGKKFNIIYWIKDNFLEVQNHLYEEGVDIDCYYLHELQHALRLCGIEKEIEL